MDVCFKLFLIVGMLTMLTSMGLLLTTNKRVESILHKIAVIWRL